MSVSEQPSKLNGPSGRLPAAGPSGPGPGQARPFSDEDKSALSSLLEAHPAEPRQLLPLLTAAQTRFKYLPEAALRAIAEYLGLPLARVFAVANFYRALSLEPQGDRIIKVCCGTACHLRGAPALIKSLEKELDMRLGQTRADGAFTLESVNCLGACALAPVLMVDEAIHGEISPAEAAELIRSYSEES